MIKGSNLFAPVQISTAYDASATGGWTKDQDNGVNYTYYVANITNPLAVLAGARAVLAEVGPLPYRRYVLSIETQPSTYGIETWRERQIRRYLSAAAPPALQAYPAALQSAYVTVPNVGFAALVAQLATVVGSPVALPFEAIAIPLFASGGATQLLSAAAAAAPVALTPLFLGQLFSSTASAYATHGVAPASAPGAVASDWTNASNPAPAGVVNVLLRGPAGLVVRGGWD